MSTKWFEGFMLEQIRKALTTGGSGSGTSKAWNLLSDTEKKERLKSSFHSQESFSRSVGTKQTLEWRNSQAVRMSKVYSTPTGRRTILETNKKAARANHLRVRPLWENEMRRQNNKEY